MKNKDTTFRSYKPTHNGHQTLNKRPMGLIFGFSEYYIRKVIVKESDEV